MAKTKMEMLEDEYKRQAQEITEACDKAREKLDAKGFFNDGNIDPKLFKEVLDNQYKYNIFEIRLMSCNLSSSGAYRVQFMVTFDDKKSTFIYLKVV